MKVLIELGLAVAQEELEFEGLWFDPLLLQSACQSIPDTMYCSLICSTFIEVWMLDRKLPHRKKACVNGRLRFLVYSALSCQVE